MKIVFRATGSLFEQVRADLRRPHPFAAERVGFISVRATTAHQGLLLIAQQYHVIADNEYVDDPSVGARIGQEALRKALEIALLNPVGMLHVHQHPDFGPLWFSRTDLREQQRFIPDFFKVRSAMPHGALVLNGAAAAGRVWLASDNVQPIAEFNLMGDAVRSWKSTKNGSVDLLV